tara:strand:- start:412 stop:930 length:519 start_codon:yes stop_codon:yes gene_type:complete
MKDDKYIWQPYNDNFRQLYREEEKKLKNILGSYITLEHCGSTAIPGLGGQGIVDIMVGSKLDLIPKISQKLQKENYCYKPYKSNKYSLFFQYNYPGIISRKIHIYLVEINKEEWVSKLAFRNFLLKYNKISAEYNELKKRVISLKEEEKEIYKDARQDFLDKLTAQALKEYA